MAFSTDDLTAMLANMRLGIIAALKALPADSPIRDDLGQLLQDSQAIMPPDGGV
jgi:hypothetical protein